MSLWYKNLIGARYFNSEELGTILVRDHHGHGTHTSSTIAGRIVTNASFLGFVNGETSRIAEKARLAIYNFTTVGGNSGFRAETVNNVAPWMITVGASTIDRKFPADVVLEDGTTITKSSLYNRKQLPNKTYFPLIYAGSTCMYGSLDPKLIHGKIVVCDCGGIRCVDKGIVVKKAGTVGVIVANTKSSGEGLIVDAHLFPGLAITLSAREKILNYIKSTKNPRATMVFHETQLGAKPALVVAVFSSRGPNP